MGDSIKREDLMQYSFYENGKMIACLDEEKIKKFLEVDILIFEETGHL